MILDDQGQIIGIARINAISMSKIINRIINKKNCKENGFRGTDLRFIPHSKVVTFSNHFFVDVLNSIGKNNISITTSLIIIEYEINISIYG